MKRILIIGAASAIARETARAFAAEGASLFLVVRDQAKLDILCQDLSTHGATNVSGTCADLDPVEAHADLVAQAWTALGEIDAALIAHGRLGDQETEQNDYAATARNLHTNFTSPVSLLTHLANRMQQAGHGLLAVIGSVAGDRGRKSNYVYGTAKAGLDAFLSGLRHRMHQHNVHVLTIKPGFVDTPMTTDLEKNALYASPKKVGHAIHRAMKRRRDVLYVPWFWRWIMLLIRHLPEPLFKRTNL